jgi:16S rRNA pseudouridine516 synthase
MRLDKYLVSTGKISRSDAGRAARGGKITVNGVVEKKADRHIDPDVDVITLHGERIIYRRYTYILLNKPAGYVSATEDGRDPTVLTLLPEELQRIGLFPCGRLDKYTLGLMLLTNDGDLSHRLLSPRHHVEKRYAYTCRHPLSREDMERLEGGVELEDGYVTKPARMLAEDLSLSGIIVLTEGKYHQIKRMFEAVDNKIETLERVTFGPLTLDPTLSRGEWRYLTDDEIALLQSGAKGVDAL